MAHFYTFSIALIFSFIGSIPPGSINITTAQYAMNGQKSAAIMFALAAAFVEFFYAIAAVQFQLYLADNIGISIYFKYISASVLILVGAYNLLQKPQPIKTNTSSGQKRGAFIKGLWISIANPLAMPFWLMVTNFLEGRHWLQLTDTNYLVYTLGISTGTFMLLLMVGWLGAKFTRFQNNNLIIYRIPGFLFIAMGIWLIIP